jgi:hypothetical protein
VLKLQDNKKIIKLQLSLCDRRKTYKSQSQSFVLVILGSQEAKIRRIDSKPAQAKLFIRPYLKRTEQKKNAGGLPQVVRVPA